MIKHAGGVLVGKSVVILAGAVVAKSLFLTPTTIGDNCQIGIMANVGHGVSIGEQSVISSNTVIAGRTKLGPRVWMGASSSIAQGLTVGEGAQIKMKSTPPMMANLVRYNPQKSIEPRSIERRPSWQC